MRKQLSRSCFVLFCLLAAGAHAQSISDEAQRDGVLFMADSDPAMDRAFRQARASLDGFLKKLKNPPAGTSFYALKVGVRDGEDTEYFWLNEIEIDGKRFSGLINNEPQLVGNVEMGQVYTFSREQIVDWMYIDEPKQRMFGNFTACALLTKQSEEDAEAFKAQYGLVCE